eukprot:9080659-Alexandrium_andersonii.AAC.1
MCIRDRVPREPSAPAPPDATLWATTLALVFGGVTGAGDEDLPCPFPAPRSRCSRRGWPQFLRLARPRFALAST